MEDIRVPGAHSLTHATTSYNLLQALTGYHSSEDHGGPVDAVISFVLTILAVAFSEHLFRFVNEIWPLWILKCFKRLLSLFNRTSVAAVDAFQNQPEEFAFDNELLVVAMEHYVAHLFHSEEEGDVVSNGDAEPSVRRSRLSPKVLWRGEYRYSPFVMPNRSGPRCLRHILKTCYRLVILPADGNAVEVERGLTVSFHQQIVSAKLLRSGRLIPPANFAAKTADCPPVNFDACSPMGKSDKPADSSDEESITETRRVLDVNKAHIDRRRRGKVLVRRAILRCSDSAEGQARILAFCRRAYDWYVSMIGSLAQRYYLHPCRSELDWALKPKCWDIPDDPERLPMRRYPMKLECNGNGFRKIFFSHKEQLVNLLTEFKEKRGQFAVPGAPQQLVILLHGPPGTGKTSVVRAVAAFLSRNIVAIPIEYFQTNARLHEILFGCRVKLVADDMFSDASEYDVVADETVYAFEDFDVVSRLISFQAPLAHRRATLPANDYACCYAIGMEGTPPSTRTPRMSDDSECIADKDGPQDECVHTPYDFSAYFPPIEEPLGLNGNDNIPATQPLLPREEDIGLPCGTGTCTDSDDSDSSDFGVNIRPEEVRHIQRQLARDFLTPEGLLRALNPNFAPPGRVILFTTNHPENLPSVLLQSGIVTLTIQLSNLDVASALQLVQHHLGDSLTVELLERFKALLSRCEVEGYLDVLNPAALEQLLLTCENAHDLLEQLELRVQSLTSIA
uniref:ATPase AAA-type core domain-containing protein n=1 Tax=Trypanosoma vivax (strain Y486) TaxID=1055687 RepID=G0U5S4_TRYVY|nr:conserved hypothetical protein [Trypanosoma vivax Y486]